MAHSLDFNSIKKPVLRLTMKDEARTVIRVTTPRASLIDRLVANLDDLESILRGKDKESIKAAFDLVADLISCNLDFLTVTGDELRTKYGMELDDMVIFVNAYLDFINELQNAKN